MFNIGDTVWHASAGQTHVWITCPECLGSGRLRVILGDETEVSIACVCCDRGCEGSPGKIQTWEFRTDIEPFLITGVESHQRDEKLTVRYSSGCWSADGSDVFATQEEALERSATIMHEHLLEEQKRLQHKEKQTKTWAWNVSYWRSEIRRAKEAIARCEARLAVAPKNPKTADQEVACPNSTSM